MAEDGQDAVSVFERDTGGHVKAAKTDIELRRHINGAGEAKVQELCPWTLAEAPGYVHS